MGHNGVTILGLDAENITKPPMVVRVPLSHMSRILSLPPAFDRFCRSAIVLTQAISEDCKINQCAIHGLESCGSKWTGVRLLSLDRERDDGTVSLLAGRRHFQAKVAVSGIAIVLLMETLA